MTITPLVIVVPGLGNSGPDHWQSLWEARRKDCQRAELGLWDAPSREVWVERLDRTVSAAGGPVVLAAHSLGCLTVAWWAAERPWARAVVRGALLVAPPMADPVKLDGLLASFAPMPLGEMPFPSIMVASQDDPYMSIEQAQDVAQNWGARLVDLGCKGHINAQSGLDDWPEGQALLDELKLDELAMVRTAGLEPARARLKGF
jgi:predicted alpha/beta hydrolase family esterase